ncbi:MAG: hypothetical protein ACRDV3_03665 [Acidothermaceae bacterium]
MRATQLATPDRTTSGGTTSGGTTADRSKVGHSRPGRARAAVLRTAVAVGACVPLITSCATGFGAPTRHAIANLQAAEVNVGQDLQIRGLIVALPGPEKADKGGVAYIEFTATNLSNQSDELQVASAQIEASAASTAAQGSSSAPSGFTDVASQQLSVGSATVPAKTATHPGVARLVVALDPLEVPLSQGDSVRVSLQFAKGGAVNDIPVPVLGADAVSSSFLPSAPPSLPSSPPASPASSALESAPVSSPPVSSAPASSPAASSPAA